MVSHPSAPSHPGKRGGRPSSRGRAASAAAAAAAIAIAPGLGGCNAACDTSYDSNPPVLYTGGITAHGVYVTSPPDGGEYLNFPGGRYYQLEHDLGFVPAEVEVWLSFDQHPTGPVSPSCTGNSCLVKRDERFIFVKNDTCSDFWLWVSASGDVGLPVEASTEDGDAASSGDAEPGVEASESSTD